MNNIFDNVPPEEILSRKRIEDLYEEAMNGKIVSVIAGAGYGKTQSVLSFVSGRQVPVIWVTASILDNYTEHFWENFCNAIRVVDEELCATMIRAGFPENASAMHYVADHLKKFIEKFSSAILVFDDCHIIKEKVICEFIITLSGMIGKNITIFMLSRLETVLNTPQNLQGKQAIIISEDVLAFTSREVRQYFEMMHISLSSFIVEGIQEKTEGWPLVVYLSALYLKEHPADAVTVLQFTETLLIEMIEKEIFSLYSLEEKRFLVKLSLLDFIPVRYMEEIYGFKERQYLSKSLLFRYNKHSHSYHIHQLFKDFLRQRITLLDESDIQETYRTSAEWFSKNGMKIDALRCYEHLGDRQGLWDIMWDTLTITSARSPSKELVRYLLEVLNKYFDDDWSEGQWIRLVKGTFNLLAADYNTAEAYLDEILQCEASPTERGLDPEVMGETLIIRALLRMLRGNVQFKQEFARARQFLPKGSKIFSAGHMILLNGDSITLSRGKRGEIEAWLEALKESAADIDHLLHNSMHGMYEVARAQAAYYRGDIIKAEQYALTALYMAEETITVDIVGYAYYILMKISMFKGDYESCQRFITSCSEYMKKNNKNLAYNFPDIAEGFFYTQIEEGDRIKDWILNESKYHESLLLSNYGLERILKAHYLLKREKYSELFTYLEFTKKIYQNGNRFIGMIYIEMIYCFAYYQTGDGGKAIETFRRVYDMTYENQMIMPLVEMGRLVRNVIPFLLRYAPDLPAPWLNMLQTKATTYRKRMQRLQADYAKSMGTYTYQEKLTLREKEVLRHIAHGLTRDEISEEMNLSINTIKSITRMAFAKLGAINSSHAIYIATRDHII